VGKPAIKTDVRVRGGEVAALKLRDGRVVAFGLAASIRIVPQIVGKAHGDIGDFVAVLCQECTNAIVFRRSVAFRKIGEAKPVPVFVVHYFAEKRLVASDVGFEILERILVEVHV